MHAIVSSTDGKTRFDVPAHVVQMSDCRDSGHLIDDACLFDPRGARSEIGWFVKGNEPRGACDRHVLCLADREGGISHGYCPEEELERVGLVRAERHFPMQILVQDAQYVYGGAPDAFSPDLNGDQAYFEAERRDACGRSYTKSPFNRSCPRHTAPSEEPPSDEWSEEDGYPITLPFFPWWRMQD